MTSRAPQSAQALCDEFFARVRSRREPVGTIDLDQHPSVSLEDLGWNRIEQREHALVERARAGDYDAFFDLVGPYEAVVRAFFTGTPAVPLDNLVQEVLVQTWRGMDKFDPSRVSLGCWLTTVSMNVARELRGEPGLRLVDQTSEPAVSEREGIGTPLDEDEQLCLLGAVRRVSAARLGILISHCLDGMSLTDVAAAMASPIEVVVERYGQARDEVRGLLRDDSILGSSPGKGGNAVAARLAALSDLELDAALRDLGADDASVLPLVRRRLRNELLDLLDQARFARDLQDREFALARAADQLHTVVRRAEAQRHLGALAEALTYLADNRRNAGDCERAGEAAKRACDVAALIGDRDARARAYLELVMVQFDQGNDVDLELGELESVCSGRSHHVAHLRYVEAKAAHRRGDLEFSLRVLKDALSLVGDSKGHLYLRCRILTRLGYLGRLAGRLEWAEVHLRAALGIARQVGYRRLEAYCLLDRGKIASLRLCNAEAEKQLRDSLRLFSDVGDVLGAAHACSTLSAHQRLQGHLREAEVLQRCALATYIHREHVAGEALARRRLGQCLRDDKRYDEARLHLDKAITMYQKLGNFDGEALATAAVAKLIRAATQKPSDALPFALAAVELLSKTKGQFHQGSALADYNRLHSWCYSLAFLCAAESGNADAAMSVASIVHADTLGRTVRLQFAQGKRPEVDEAVVALVNEIIHCELSLSTPSDDPVGYGPNWSANPADVLRLRLSHLYDSLRARAKRVAEELQVASKESLPVRLNADEHRLTVHTYEEMVPPVLERGGIVMWETASGAQTVTKIAPDDWECLETLASCPDVALENATDDEMTSLAALLLPAELMDALLDRRVDRLLVVLCDNILNLPFGDCLLRGKERLRTVTVLDVDTGNDSAARRRSLRQ